MTFRARRRVSGVGRRDPWTTRRDGESEERFDVLPAWLMEDLPGGRVRVPTA
ncbi:MULTISPECIES: hypothetical protein [Streptomyces]|uniref:Uncharacterized protein n=1 Tax=Streptomyces doebereineriae TaxID=3075528 RepID=A0ABU2V8X2_9ACTN|nr:hypothetical protein [Streptomyces sp. DSM 41640]MDT0482014.1 hypothetical protein [Streptomyces sp. DSM 41640]